MPKQEHEGITVDGKPLTTYIEEEETLEIEKHRVEEIMDAAAGVGYVAPATKYANISGKRSQYSNTIKTYSSEVLAHLNYLRESQGEKAVTDYLNSGSQNGNHNGSIESVLKDAEEKVRFFNRQAAEAQAQATRWSAVKAQLQSALDMLSGKVPIESMAGSAIDLSDKESRMRWKEKIKEFLTADHRSRPELDRFLESNGASQAQRYNIVSNYKSRGFIELAANGDDVTWIGA